MRTESLALFIAVGSLIVGCSPKGSRPGNRNEAIPVAEILLEPPEVDLGQVPLGSKKRFAAKLRNNSDRPLVIRGFSSSCGCTEVGLTEPMCPPNTAIEVRGTYEANENPGAFRQRVTLSTDREETPLLVLELVGRAESIFSVDPPRVDLSPGFFSRAGDKQEIQLTNRSTHSVQFYPPAILPAGVQMTIGKEHLVPGETMKVTFAAMPQHFGTIDENIKLLTSHPEQKGLVIPVRVHCPDGISVSPAAVRLGVASRAELTEPTSKIVLSVAGDGLRHFDLLDAVCPNFLDVVSSERLFGADQSREVVLRFKPGFEGAELRGDILIRFRRKEGAPNKYPESHEIRVNVSGLLQD